jgi:hypothetical protein
MKSLEKLEDPVALFEKRKSNFLFFHKKINELLYEQNFPEIMEEETGYLAKFMCQLNVIKKYHLGKEISQTEFSQLIFIRDELFSKLDRFEKYW